MTTSPLVSVIMPAFNAEQTIEEAISSVIDQELADWELIICDDASTDATVACAQAFCDARVRILRNSENVGPGASRNRAMDAAIGRWFAFLDADDVWNPKRLAQLTSVATSDERVVVFDNLLFCHQTPTGLKPWRSVHKPGAFGSAHQHYVDVPPEQWARSRQLVMQPMLPVRAIRASNIVHGERRFQEDTDFILRLVAGGFTLRYVPKVYYYYRITSGSLCSVRDSGTQTRNMLESVLPLFSDMPAMHSALSERIAYRYFTDAAKSRHWVAVMRQVSSNPALSCEFITRIIDQTLYQVDRIIKRGTGRYR